MATTSSGASVSAGVTFGPTEPGLQVNRKSVEGRTQKRDAGASRKSARRRNQRLTADENRKLVGQHRRKLIADASRRPVCRHRRKTDSRRKLEVGRQQNPRMQHPAQVGGSPEADLKTRYPTTLRDCHDESARRPSGRLAFSFNGSAHCGLVRMVRQAWRGNPHKSLYLHLHAQAAEF